jgi:Mn2+/Fe2+ NRAMP family transporter
LWALPAALFVWALLWFLTFGVIEKSVSLAGLVTAAFVIAAGKMGAVPPAAELVPALPKGQSVEYAFLAVSIIGAIITPAMFFFYSAGAIEEKWDKSYLGVNRLVAVLGMSFGAVIALAVIAIAATVLRPQGLRVESYAEAMNVPDPVFPRWGPALFIASLGIVSFGAAVEVSLSSAYEAAQTLGWNWGKEQKASDEARFTLTYTVLLFAAALPIVAGLDPLKLTVFTMALVCLMLPFVTFPFLVLMNDTDYMGEQINSRWTNFVVVGIVAIAFVLAAVAIPLQVLGGS